jgi:flagellar hook protein FlgE
MGFAQGVSGLNSSASNLDVIGNNIANSSTVGFKSGSSQFSDIYAGMGAGGGVQISGIQQNFTGGSIQSSTRSLDMAVANGDGFFRLTSPAGEVAFTRNGQFNSDKNGYIVNAAGMQLSGFQVGANGSVSGGTASALRLPTAAMEPKATSEIVTQLNLDARAVVPAATPFDPNNSGTYNYANAATAYDSLGNTHELSSFFVKTGANTWDVYATADGLPLAAGGAFAPAAPAAGSGGSAIGSLVFNSSGVLTSPASGKLNVNAPGVAFSNGSAPMPYDLNINSTTQFGTQNDVKKLSQNGYTSGQLTSFAISPDGTVNGKYSNEMTLALGQVALSSFANPNGLQPKGSNVWVQTSASGQALTVKPGSGTRAGSIASGAVEASNVDLTSELVNLIIAQRTYQANAQTVKTQDQVMQTLINMR